MTNRPPNDKASKAVRFAPEVKHNDGPNRPEFVRGIKTWETVYVHQLATEHLKKMDEKIRKVTARVHEPIPGAEWLSTDASELRDVMMAARKPLVDMLRGLDRSRPPTPQGVVDLVEAFMEFQSDAAPLNKKAEEFLGNFDGED